MSSNSPELRIRSREELLAALRSPQPEVRLAVLRALLADPTPLQRLGVEPDFELSEQGEECLVWVDLLARLGDHERLFRVLEQAHHPLLMARAARCLRGHCPERLGRLLKSCQDSDRKRIVATMLASTSGLEPETQLLTCLWSEASAAPPALVAETLELWLRHLDHPRARSWAEQVGDLTLLASSFEQLSRASQEWLVARVPQALLGRPEGWVVAACVERLAAPGFEDDPRAEVRAAAYRLGPLPADWRQRWGREECPEARVALAGRAVAEMTQSELLQLVQQDSWELRALAAPYLDPELLSELPPSLENAQLLAARHRARI